MHFFKIYKYFHIAGTLTLFILSLLELAQALKPHFDSYRNLPPVIQKKAKQLAVPLAKRLLKNGLKANIGLLILIALLYAFLITVNIFIFGKH